MASPWGRVWKKEEGEEGSLHPKMKWVNPHPNSHKYKRVVIA